MLISFIYSMLGTLFYLIFERNKLLNSKATIESKVSSYISKRRKSTTIPNNFTCILVISFPELTEKTHLRLLHNKLYSLQHIKLQKVYQYTFLVSGEKKKL